MNTYEITFQRENGTTGSDRFTAATEAQARRDFREVYRHGNGQIIKAELISTGTLATKEQERKALEKIKKIVEELGKGSYIGTAFAGCFEIAESNIENDFADSMKERYEQAKEDGRLLQPRGQYRHDVPVGYDFGCRQFPGQKERETGGRMGEKSPVL